MADHPYIIGYRATDNINHLSLVIVGTRKIDVDRLIVQGVVKGIEAIPGHVWLNAPTFNLERLD